MGNKNTNILQEHSKAKVDLYTRYLSIYLNIISRAPFINKIKLFDLFAGEGIYENKEDGSPIAALKVIKDHYFSNNKTCPNIDILFNDNGNSKIEPNKTKIQRIKEKADSIFIPSNVNVDYLEIPFSELVSNILIRTNAIVNNERALLFIDPWGYKDIKPTEIRKLLSNKKSEIILFLPISHMYRFAEKSLSIDEFPAGKPLMDFLNELSINESDLHGKQINFINLLKSSFLSFLNVEYVDTFTIEKGKRDYFCLFFFTNNQTGFKAMLKAKWDIDEKQGKGFRIGDPNQQTAMFEDIEISNYDKLLFDFIKNNGQVTNRQIHDFGLTNCYLPSHSIDVLKALKSKDKIYIEALDNKPIRGFYIEDKERRILIKIK